MNSGHFDINSWHPVNPAPQSELDWFRDSIKLFKAHSVTWAQWQYGCLFERDGTPIPPLRILLPEQDTL